MTRGPAAVAARHYVSYSHYAVFCFDGRLVSLRVVGGSHIGCVAAHLPDGANGLRLT
jgi:hypothetical protein